MRDRNLLDISDVFMSNRSEIRLILFMLLSIVLNLFVAPFYSVGVLRDCENLRLHRPGPLGRSGCQVHRPFHNGRIIS